MSECKTLEMAAQDLCDGLVQTAFEPYEELLPEECLIRGGRLIHTL